MNTFKPRFLSTKKREFVCFKELNKALSQWANELKKSDVEITANMAKEKAAELSSAMGFNLTPSTAWLYKWKERENIQFTKRTNNPEDILKLFLSEREKIELLQRVHDQNFKTDKSDTEKHISNDQVVKNQCSSGSAVESKKTKSVKRDYVKRLTVMDVKGRSRKERTFLTLLQKYEIIHRLNNGENRNDLLIEYNLSHSAMSQIIVDKKKILKLAAGGQNLLMKRIRGGKFKDGEAELNTWVREKMKNGESLTRIDIKKRAKEVAARLNIDFKASEGWLQKWKARMNLDFNENQKLERKVPAYTPTDEEFENSKASPEESDSLSDQECANSAQEYSDMPDIEIKEEQIDYDYSNRHMEDMNTNGEFVYNHEADVKKEFLTPQLFYLQTIHADNEASTICNNTQSEKPEKEDYYQEKEEPDVKPFLNTSLNIPKKEDLLNSSETLHVKVKHWLNLYNIAPEAASELMNILQQHINP